MAALLVWAVWPIGPAGAVLDTYLETFDGRTSDATIDGIDLWHVAAGASTDALVQAVVTPTGSGNAVRLASASTPVDLARSTSYGNLSPTWVKVQIRPGAGGERRSAPASGIAAVTFDYTGSVLASDGTAWVNTGKSYSGTAWWDVIYKLNFDTHTYDLYVRQTDDTAAPFVPAKTGLSFIDPSKNSLTGLTFGGAYSAAGGDTYLDNCLVMTIDRLTVVTAAQTLTQGKSSGPITVQLQNSVSESQRAPGPIALELKSTSGSGRFSLASEPWQDISTITLLEGATSATFYYKDPTVGKPVISMGESPDQGWQDGLQQQTVVSVAPRFDVAMVSPQVAGVPFTASLTARDEFGEIDPAYNGTVGLTVVYVEPKTGTKPVTPVSATGFVNGRLEVPVTYTDAGLIQITATDSSETSKTGTSGQLHMLPAAFGVSADASQVAGRAFPLVVTALNAAGQVTPNYRGLVNLGVQGIAPTTGLGTLTPPTISADSFAGGTATAEVSYSRWGSIKVTATDAAVWSATGVSAPVMYHPAALQATVSAPPAPREFFYSQEPFTITVSPLAHDGTPMANYQGTVTVSAAAALGLPAQYTFVATDLGTHTFNVSAGTAGTHSATFTDAAAGVTSPTVSVTVKEAIIKVISTSAPIGGAAEVTIILVDDQGNIIESESSVTVNLKFVEEMPNQTTSSSAFNQPVKIVKGKGTIILSDTEEEIVTLIPSSPFGGKVQNGTVTFNRAAVKGIGVQLWREVTKTR